MASTANRTAVPIQASNSPEAGGADEGQQPGDHGDRGESHRRDDGDDAGMADVGLLVEVVEHVVPTALAEAGGATHSPIAAVGRAMANTPYHPPERRRWRCCWRCCSDGSGGGNGCTVVSRLEGDMVPPDVSIIVLTRLLPPRIAYAASRCTRAQRLHTRAGRASGAPGYTSFATGDLEAGASHGWRR